MNSYELSRKFFDWSFENPDKIKPIHSAIYFFSIEHCNRLGWKEKFGLPSQMVMEAIGVKNWRTYSAGLNDLIDFGFISLIEKSTNQYSSNIIAIVNFTKAPTKALDKALQKHDTKQSKSTVSIDKQYNNEQLTNNLSDFQLSILEFYNFRIKLKKPIIDASKEQFVKKLMKLSNNNEDVAIEILNQSIANGWQGIFELKTNNNGITEKKSRFADY